MVIIITILNLMASESGDKIQKFRFVSLVPFRNHQAYNENRRTDKSGGYARLDTEYYR